MSPKHRHDMIVSLLPLVRKIAGAICARRNLFLNEDDLFGAGCIGLISAVDRFDSSRGMNIKNYAGIRIRGAIYDELRRFDSEKRKMRTEKNWLTDVAKTMTAELGRPPRTTELMKKTGLTGTQLSELMQDVKMVTSNVDGVESSSIDPLEIVFLKKASRIVRNEISLLPERQRMVMTKLYFEGYTLEKLASEMGVHMTRVFQIKDATITKLLNRVRDKVKKQSS